MMPLTGCERLTMTSGLTLEPRVPSRGSSMMVPKGWWDQTGQPLQAPSTPDRDRGFKVVAEQDAGMGRTWPGEMKEKNKAGSRSASITHGVHGVLGGKSGNGCPPQPTFSWKLSAKPPSASSAPDSLGRTRPQENRMKTSTGGCAIKVSQA